MAAPVITEEQRALRREYCNLMTEIKFRVEGIQRALNGDYQIPIKPAFEFCHLQSRLICETIALACLAAHGDKPEIATRKMKDDYRADRILNRLERLNAQYFPEAGFRLGDDKSGMLFASSDPQPMTKEELLRFYFKCDERLHRGTFALLRNRVHPDFSDIEQMIPKVIALLKFHRIVLAEPEYELWVDVGMFPKERVRARLVGP